MFSLASQSPKINANKTRVSSAFTLKNNFQNTIIHGFEPIMKKFDKNEFLNIEALAEINYQKEFKKDRTIINVTNNNTKQNIEYKKINVFPKSKNIRSISAIQDKRQNMKSEYDYNLKLYSESYLKDFNNLIKENEEKASLTNKKLLLYDKESHKKPRIINNNNASDIFNRTFNVPKHSSFNTIQNTHNEKLNSNVILMDETTSRYKSGETYALDKFKPKTFCGTTLSNSEITQNSNKLSLINHSSTTTNPIIPNIININAKLKNEIIIESNGCLKSKAISRIVDSNRNGAPNHNKLFREEIKKDKNVFNKKISLCTNFYDIYSQYKGICNKPFTNK